MGNKFDKLKNIHTLRVRTHSIYWGILLMAKRGTLF